MVGSLRRLTSGSAAQRHRLSWRLVRHHAALAVLSVALCAGVFAALPGADDAYRLSMATAYTGLAFLAATLVLGPLNVLRNRPRPLSDDLRRDIGIWTAIVSVVHVIVGIQIHMGSPLLYFFYGPGERPGFWPLPVRIDPFGLSNHTGLVATVVVIVLLLLSNDLSMRALGNRWWKRLQQLNYGLLAMVIVHGILYQRNEKQEPGWIIVFWILWLAALVFQLVGFRIRSSRIAGRGPNLAPADLAESNQ